MFLSSKFKQGDYIADTINNRLFVCHKVIDLDDGTYAYENKSENPIRVLEEDCEPYLDWLKKQYEANKDGEGLKVSFLANRFLTGFVKGIGDDGVIDLEMKVGYPTLFNQGSAQNPTVVGIKDFEMPKDCYHCPMVHFENHPNNNTISIHCNVTEKSSINYTFYKHNKLYGCPLCEIEYKDA